MIWWSQVSDVLQLTQKKSLWCPVKLKNCNGVYLSIHVRFEGVFSKENISVKFVVWTG